MEHDDSDDAMLEAARSQPIGEREMSPLDVSEGNVSSIAPANPSFVYALGKVEPRFQSLAVEKEFAQAASRAETEGLADRQVFQSVLAKRENHYLARQLCWVMTIEGLETYILVARGPAELDLLIDSIRPRPTSGDLDVVIGVRGSIAPPEMCNGLMVPVVAFDQLYSFDRDSLLQGIPRPEPIQNSQEEAQVQEQQFQASAEELFDRIMQLADNAGATDEHRALNYLAVRYDRTYVQTAEMYNRNFSLMAVDVRQSRLSGTRNIVDVIFSYAHRTTDVTEKYFVRVDVTEEFPFLVTKLSPYYDR